MTNNNDIAHNIRTILTRIENACQSAGRSPDTVKLLLATKTVSPERIKIALATGQMLIAENKVQEAKEKYPALLDTPHSSHFIGHLQTNKVKDLLKCDIRCIQSLDRPSLAEKLHHELSKAGKSIDVLIQVNTSGEDSKFGIAPSAALQLAQDVAAFDTLHIKGLMTIGILSDDENEVRACFHRLTELQAQIRALNLPNVSMDELSMGMSGDLEIAISEGATIIRVGTAIFGQRG